MRKDCGQCIYMDTKGCDEPCVKCYGYTNLIEKECKNCGWFIDNVCMHGLPCMGADKWKPIASKTPEVDPESALSFQEGGSHYKGWKIEPVQFIIANRDKLPGAESSIIRYACRHTEKNGVEDLKKIIHYAKLIAELHYGVRI